MEHARIYLTYALEPWQNQLPLIGFVALVRELTVQHLLELKVPGASSSFSPRQKEQDAPATLEFHRERFFGGRGASILASGRPTCGCYRDTFPSAG